MDNSLSRFLTLRSCMKWRLSCGLCGGETFDVYVLSGDGGGTKGGRGGKSIRFVS